MPLYGTFDTIQLADLTQWIQGSRLDGTLTVTVDTEDTYLVFEDGDLVALGSDDPLRRDLGQELLARGLVSEPDLHEVLRGSGGGAEAVTALLEAGIVDEEQVAEVQREHALETVLDLFFHTSGSFHFSSGEGGGLLDEAARPETTPLQRPIATRELLVEAMRRLDEWHRMREVIPSQCSVVRALEGESDVPAWRDLRALGAPVSVEALCLRLNASRYEVYRQLYGLHSEGLVAFDELGGGQSDHARLGPVHVLVDNARLLIEEKQFDEAREVLSTAVNLNPDSGEARELLRELRRLQLEHLYQQLQPHRVPLLTAAAQRLDSMDLGPREKYLISRLEGGHDVATLVVATPLGELETLRILSKLLHAGIVRLS
jgi:hypothetical protein